MHNSGDGSGDGVDGGRGRGVSEGTNVGVNYAVSCLGSTQQLIWLWALGVSSVVFQQKG